MSCSNFFVGGKEGKVRFDHMAYEVEEESLIKSYYKSVVQPLADNQCRAPNLHANDKLQAFRFSFQTRRTGTMSGLYRSCSCSSV